MTSPYSRNPSPPGTSLPSERTTSGTLHASNRTRLTSRRTTVDTASKHGCHIQVAISDMWPNARRVKAELVPWSQDVYDSDAMLQDWTIPPIGWFYLNQGGFPKVNRTGMVKSWDLMSGLTFWAWAIHFREDKPRYIFSAYSRSSLLRNIFSVRTSSNADLELRRYQDTLGHHNIPCPSDLQNNMHPSAARATVTMVLGFIGRVYRICALKRLGAFNDTYI